MRTIEVWISRRSRSALHLDHLPKQFTVAGTKTAGLPSGWLLERLRENVRLGCTLYRVSHPTAAWLKQEAENVVKAGMALGDRDAPRTRAAARLVQDLELMLETAA